MLVTCLAYSTLRMKVSLPPSFCWLRAWFTLWIGRWRQWVLPKCRWTSTGLLSVISQKTVYVRPLKFIRRCVISQPTVFSIVITVKSNQPGTHWVGRTAGMVPFCGTARTTVLVVSCSEVARLGRPSQRVTEYTPKSLLAKQKRSKRALTVLNTLPYFYEIVYLKTRTKWCAHLHRRMLVCVASNWLQNVATFWLS
jgi:hypothetical protein